MLTPLAARIPTRISATSANKLASQRSTPVAHRPGDRATAPGVAWDFGNISIFPPGTAIQQKLVVGEIDDPLEHEADRVADRVMRMAARGPLIAADPLQLSRKCAACEEGAAHTLQPKRLPLSKAAIDEAPPIVHEVLRSPGQPLDTASRTFFESRFGYDFGRVRVHADTQAVRSARVIGALAYTRGNHIVFGQTSSYGILAHELAHVVQQGTAAPSDGVFAGSTSGTGASVGAVGEPQVQRQTDALAGLNMPAFPCDRGGGIELCNTTTDSPSAPNYMQCLQSSKGIIDGCKGGQDDCLAQAKCAFCGCVGEKYCQCTGIV